MRQRQPPHVKFIASGVHVALIACIGEARGYSDFTLALRYVTGFGIIGPVEKTGLWREKSADEMRKEMSDKRLPIDVMRENVTWERRLRSMLHAKAFDPEFKQELELIWEMTMAEVTVKIPCVALSR